MSTIREPAPGLLRASRLRKRGLVGTGGIGTGSFFLLEGMETLGREESRGGRLLDRRDYCKLHIVCHYVVRLLGPTFAVIPIGRIGDDEPGRRLLGEMRETGIELRRVTVDPSRQTLASFCLLYPDGSGGNLTLLDSASSAVDEADIEAAMPDIGSLGASGVALADRHPRLHLIVTDGARGSWAWDGTTLTHEPPLPVAVAAAAGAGDALLAGVVAGPAAGLDFAAAHQLGVLVAAVSVTSPHTIHPRMDRGLLAATMRAGGTRWLPGLRAMLE